MDEELGARNLSSDFWESQLDPNLVRILDRIDELSTGGAESSREEVAKELLDYSWTQRLYFVVRSGVMGVIGAIVTASIVASLGTADAFQVVIISVGSFVVTLAITRLFDDQMSRISKTIVGYLSRYRTIRNLIVNHF